MKTKTLNILICSFLAMFLNEVTAQPEPSNLLPEANRDYAFDYTPLEPVKFASFAEAAAWADVVAIAQVINIDYLQTRELNASGQGFLTVRVPYKGVKKDDLLIISSKGFEEHVCYYPDRVEEGQRYLVFLKESANQGEYHGFKPFCQLQVLLTDTGEYALRYPQELGFELDPELVRELNFNDPHSEIDATEWTHIAREQHQQEYDTTLREDSDMFQKYFYLQYTRGIMIYEIRKLLQLTTQPRIHSDQI
ncbi:hypothetical protein ACFODZ_06525 [Marinicella sediminis]|uniref:DUF4384 domain-containing protein n=1 Tax=Marinicella sediminis TaxID=1792834 RepID=A0ABV7JAH4_9GAMM|nr:hypothetical protein [Marinicella sediminis]